MLNWFVNIGIGLPSRHRDMPSSVTLSASSARQRRPVRETRAAYVSTISLRPLRALLRVFDLARHTHVQSPKHHKAGSLRSHGELPTRRRDHLTSMPLFDVAGIFSKTTKRSRTPSRIQIAYYPFMPTRTSSRTAWELTIQGGHDVRD